MKWLTKGTRREWKETARTCRAGNISLKWILSQTINCVTKINHYIY